MLILVYVILNEVKNLAVSTDSHPLGGLEILRFAQDDNQWVATMILSTVILNEVKNLSVSADSHPLGGLEILRFAQDDSQCLRMTPSSRTLFLFFAFFAKAYVLQKCKKEDSVSGV